MNPYAPSNASPETGHTEQTGRRSSPVCGTTQAFLSLLFPWRRCGVCESFRWVRLTKWAMLAYLLTISPPLLLGYLYLSARPLVIIDHLWLIAASPTLILVSQLLFLVFFGRVYVHNGWGACTSDDIVARRTRFHAGENEDGHNRSGNSGQPYEPWRGALAGCGSTLTKRPGQSKPYPLS
jgi:hypothetical protein